MKYIMKKLHSPAGESIAETLIALLIAAVALMMLASMISSTVSLVTTSKERIKEYYDGNINLELQDDASDPKPVTVTFQATGAGDYLLKQETPAKLFQNVFFNAADKVVYAYTADSD